MHALLDYPCDLTRETQTEERRKKEGRAAKRKENKETRTKEAANGSRRDLRRGRPNPARSSKSSADSPSKRPKREVAFFRFTANTRKSLTSIRVPYESQASLLSSEEDSDEDYTVKARDYGKGATNNGGGGKLSGKKASNGTSTRAAKKRVEVKEDSDEEDVDALNQEDDQGQEPLQAKEEDELGEQEVAGEDAEVDESKGEQPRLVTGATMKSYQISGMEWLISLYENGLNGILADEMGLGKTLQTISFLAYLRDKGVWGPFLVCCPLSTLANWVNEFERFTPDIPVVLYHGTPQERAQIREERLSHPTNEKVKIVKEKKRKGSRIGHTNTTETFPVIVTS